MSRTTPLTPVEEAVYHLEEFTDSWNVQIEVETDDVDATRLYDAAVAAGEHHPMARARLDEHGGLDSRLYWRIPDDVDGLEFDSVEAYDTSDVDEIRREFYSRGFDVVEDLPYRVRHVDGPDGDRVLFSFCHVPCDGVGALRLVRTVSDVYRGREPEPDPVDFDEYRSAVERLRPDDFGGKLRQLVNAAGHLPNAVDRPSRVAGESDDGDERWGFVHREVDDTASLVDGRPEGVSVNDLLLAAFHLAIERWNTEHDAGAGKVSLMMPVNLRPTEWFYDVVGNYVLFDRVATRPRHRDDVRSAVAEVARQTHEIKHAETHVGLLESMKLIPRGTPVGLRGRLTEFLRGPGEGLMDTAVLSNLGRAPEPVEFGSDAALYFSPPCRAATSVAIGAVTVDGTLYLVLRHTLEHLDRAAAERLMDVYMDELDRVERV